MFFDGDFIDFDNLCDCGDPECPVGKAAAAAKKLYRGEGISPEEGRALAEAFAGVVLLGKELNLQMRFVEAALRALTEQGTLPTPPLPPQPAPEQPGPRRNPFNPLQG